ncbi:hypothetical protein [Actinomadura livida]|uniref:Uncharacterized protein n=1 Tax=Actinomadura livida TaxID=79909 RepID=A0A7W7MYE1_9ACTN|nr:MULTISPECIES: hypothetical protein [Actinomadura]MBB4775703.1 hypothetical protein [Actinomadura catellatispora]GGU34528.1 hypothetical protein GCM10010208_68910 [Actinomadura livida]
MRARRPARHSRSLPARIAGYAGTVLLVAAAVVVLLIPLIDDGKGADGAGAQSSPSQTASPGGPAGVPGDPVLPGAPTGPAPQQDGSGLPAPGGPQDGGGQGGGPALPGQGGTGELTWCPDGTASYRATGTGIDVVITVASSGAIRAELVLQGRAPESQQATVPGGRPHTFHFRGVSPALVERVKVTTVSVGVNMQTCYARVG